jgi:serine protease Do
VSWQRDGQALDGKLALPEGWRKTDITWRPSMHRFVPSLYLSGDELSDEEKQALGLPAKHLAFRQEAGVSSRAREAGFRSGDIVAGVDDKQLEINVTQFPGYIRRNYLVGDRITINIIRDGKRLNLPLTLR